MGRGWVPCQHPLCGRVWAGKTPGRSRKLQPRRSPSLPTSREATLAWGGFGVGLGQDPTDSGARVTAEEKNILPASPSRDLSTLLAAFWTLWEAEAVSPTVFLNGGGGGMLGLSPSPGTIVDRRPCVGLLLTPGFL